MTTSAQDDISAHQVSENWKTFLFELIITIVVAVILVFRASEKKRNGKV